MEKLPNKQSVRLGLYYTLYRDGRVKSIHFGGKWLTAIDVTSGEMWQADNHGNLREKPV